VILHNLELANIYSIDGDINKGWQWSQQDPITDLSGYRGVKRNSITSKPLD